MTHAPLNADVVAARLASQVAEDCDRVRGKRLIATAYRTARDAARQNRRAVRAPAASLNLAVSGYTPADLVDGRAHRPSRFAETASRLVGLHGVTLNGEALEAPCSDRTSRPLTRSSRACVHQLHAALDWRAAR